MVWAVVNVHLPASVVVKKNQPTNQLDCGFPKIIKKKSRSTSCFSGLFRMTLHILSTLLHPLISSGGRSGYLIDFKGALLAV